MSQYSARYTGLLQKAGITVDALPGDLVTLIQTYSKAAAALERSEAGTQQRLLYILVQTDAVICATIYSLYKDQLDTTDILPEQAAPADTAKLDKIKLLVLKAKALQLKTKR